ncbi:AI-2E family transporter [Sphingosinithalassobacter sp. LHW66-3]|uniref:AI-2E family transporter n=1 Tax=Sphingosinithalassobacter sp. LHW66-3 TaxID=3424718 RepID=UPI003D6B90D8
MREDDSVSVYQEPGPNEMRDPVIRAELKRASVWFGLAVAVGLVVLLIHPLLIIFGGLVFASMLDGGVRLLGRVAPLPRPVRLALVVMLVTIFIGGTFYAMGVQIVEQAEQLRATLEAQSNRIARLAVDLGLMESPTDFSGLAQQVLGSIGRLTSAVGSLLGAGATLLMIMIIGLFVAMEPRIYDRGLQWMVPVAERDEFAITITAMATNMRRLLAGRLAGMLFEGVVTWLLLWLAGVPMALLLGIITGILAFIPNIGAFVSGVLMVSVGFSAGTSEGLWAIAIYFGVQTFDGYVVIPMVARRTVDLPPALTLSSQILFSTLFGVLGLALADPMLAMIKVALQRESQVSAKSRRRRGRRRGRRGGRIVASPEEPPPDAAVG